MLLEFVAIIAAGFALAGVALTLNILLRRRLPKWIVPASAGAGMLAMAIWLEYSWLERATANLPQEIEVVSTNRLRAWYRPWTYVVPQVNRLIAVDHRFERRNDALPGQVLTRVLLLGRWEPSRQFGTVLDCTAGRRADLTDQVEFTDSGSLADARWIDLPPDDPLLRAICGD